MVCSRILSNTITSSCEKEKASPPVAESSASLPHTIRGRNEPKRHLGVVAKLRKLHVVQQAAGRLDDVFALLRGLLHFASQEQAAGPRHLSNGSIVTSIVR